MTYLNDLITHMILIHMNGVVNGHIISWRGFFKLGLEKNFVPKMLSCTTKTYTPVDTH